VQAQLLNTGVWQPAMATIKGIPITDAYLDPTVLNIQGPEEMQVSAGPPAAKAASSKAAERKILPAVSAQDLNNELPAETFVETRHVTEYLGENPDYLEWLKQEMHGIDQGHLPADPNTLAELLTNKKGQDITKRSLWWLALRGQEDYYLSESIPKHLLNNSISMLDTIATLVFLGFGPALTLVSLSAELFLSNDPFATILTIIGSLTALSSLAAFLSFNKNGPFKNEGVNIFAIKSLIIFALSASQMGMFSLATETFGLAPTLAASMSFLPALPVLATKLYGQISERIAAFQGLRAIKEHDQSIEDFTQAYDRRSHELIPAFFQENPEEYLQFIKAFLPTKLKEQRKEIETKRDEFMEIIRKLKKAKEKSNEITFPSKAQRSIVMARLDAAIERYEDLVQELNENVLTPINQALQTGIPEIQAELQNLVDEIQQEKGRTANQSEILALLQEIGENYDLEREFVLEQSKRMETFQDRLTQFFEELRAMQLALVDVDRSYARMRLPG